MAYVHSAARAMDGCAGVRTNGPRRVCLAIIRLSLCLFPPSAGSAAYFMKGKRWRGVTLSEGAHKRLDKEQAVVQLGKGEKGEQLPAVLCVQRGVHLLVALVVWRAGRHDQTRGLSNSLSIGSGESGCFPVSIFAVDADDNVGMAVVAVTAVAEGT
ncbi:hypothetical protein C8F04DRAFT_1301650, partial [Mycena alexandri]